VFDAWLEEAVADPAARDAALAHWSEAPEGRTAHPREEHLMPLMVAAGAAPGQPGQVAFRDQVMDVVISAIEFGRAAWATPTLSSERDRRLSSVPPGATHPPSRASGSGLAGSWLYVCSAPEDADSGDRRAARP
jgi:hypothetical protein